MIAEVYDLEVVDPIDGWSCQAVDFEDAQLSLSIVREAMELRGDNPDEAYVQARIRLP